MKHYQIGLALALMLYTGIGYTAEKKYTYDGCEMRKSTYDWFKSENGISYDYDIDLYANKFSERSRTYCKIDKDYSSDIVGSYAKNVIQEGNYKGIDYRLHDDGSGSMQGDPYENIFELIVHHEWSFSCNVDKMKDSHFCTVSKGSTKAILGILRTDTGRQSAVVGGGSAYPGSRAIIRVDDNEPIYGDEHAFTEAQTLEVIKQMKTGKKVRVRYYDWPYNSAKEDEFPIYAFTEALELRDWLVENIK